MATEKYFRVACDIRQCAVVGKLVPEASKTRLVANANGIRRTKIVRLQHTQNMTYGGPRTTYENRFRDLCERHRNLDQIASIRDEIVASAEKYGYTAVDA